MELAIALFLGLGTLLLVRVALTTGAEALFDSPVPEGAAWLIGIAAGGIAGWIAERAFGKD